MAHDEPDERVDADFERSPLLNRIGSMVYPSASHPEAPSATVAQTCFIILSIYIGLGMLSQPYGLRLGGWAALAALGATAALFFLSASLLAKASDLLPHGYQRTFPVLGGVLAGPAGRCTVSGMAALELFGAVTIAVVVILSQLELLLPAKGTPLEFELSYMKLLIINAYFGEDLYTKELLHTIHWLPSRIYYFRFSTAVAE